jgi:hypothetical protein
MAKSPGFAPVKLTPPTRSGPVPVFVRVTVCAGALEPTAVVGKLILAEAILTAGIVPVPERVTPFGELDASLGTLRLAVRAPVVLGVKVTLILQVAPGGRTTPLQVSVGMAKSAALLPVMLAGSMVREVLPVFVLVNVTLCAGVV